MRDENDLPPVDLKPQEWRSEREKPREPIFGKGAGAFLGELLIAAIGLGLLILVLLLGVYAKDKAAVLLYGAPETKSYVPPGNYEWTPEKGLVPKQASPVLQPGESTDIDGYKIKRTK